MRFLLVDRILRLEQGKEAVILKNVSNSEDFFADHLPGRPIMPGCLILESCDQAARLLLAKSTGFQRLPRLEQVANGKFRYFVQPGDSLQVHVSVVSQNADGATVRAAASVGDRSVAQASLTYSLVDAAGDPGATRACAQLREFVEALSTDVLSGVMESRARDAGPGGDAAGA
ncbi:MAG TPA: 3-hydroxyacyl-ACP dehydratase FabZ family protein [Candidatus Methylomirabilis sp.]|nr:3-hydroxyacyl-ACP dehydratase FabZ family protein [Candidatus Methylomirabilis sp.]